MNTKQLQFNRRWVAALLLAGSILAATVVSLTWTDVSTSQAQWEAGSEKVDSVEYDSGLPSWSQFRFIAGRKPGVGAGSGSA